MARDMFVDMVSTAVGKLMEPPPGLEFDFSKPPGEPALVAADSISWRIFKNPVSLFVGGVTAVILELAEPSVRTGVWEHSSFRRDAATRLRRTGFAAMMTVYGPRSAAEKMIERIVRMHDRIRGTTPEGIEYHANDPRLLDWVQATASFGFIEAYHRYVTPLTDAQRSQAFAESALAASLYGAKGAPKSLVEWHRALRATEPMLVKSDIIFEFLEIMRTTPLLPPGLGPFQRLFVQAAVDIVPPQVLDRIGLAPARFSRANHALVRSIGRLADRIPVKAAPPAQASRRLGLAPDFLYR